MKHVMQTLKRMGVFLSCTALAVTMAGPAGIYVRAAQTPEEIRRTADALNAENQAPNGAESDTPGKETLSRITLSVGDGQKTPTYKAGDKKAELKINVANSGNTDAQNVRISPVVQKPEEWPFEMDQLNYDQDLGMISAGKQAAAVWGSDADGKLTVRSDVTGKSYKLIFKITYDDGKQTYETEKYVFVRTEAKKSSSSGSSGDKPSGGTASGSGSKPSGGAASGSGSKPAGDASSGGTGGGSAQGDDEIPSGGVYNSEPVASGGSGGASSDAPADASVPRVIVTGFDTAPATVKAGDDFRLTIHLKNTSKKTAVRNMLFDLQAPASGADEAAEAPAFLPTSGSSSIYLEGIPAGGTKDISIELNSRADLIQKPYSITMGMLYENKNAEQFESQSSLAIPVTQEARFEFSDIQIMPDTAEIGEEANITCSIYNLGRVKMYNVKVGFEGDAIEGQELFLGNLESGATGMVDGIVTALAESYEENNCRLVMSYEDDAGNMKETKQEFTMTVTQPVDDMVMADDFPVTDEEEPGGHTGLIIALIAGIVLAGGIAAVVIIRRRKKKSDREEEEWFDEVERSAEDEPGES
ncbi:MAG TPA: hypothetical protein H9910_07120 [Candidatus Mediterraneibacter quadrami]|uniref:CARDB domain-containing protein n=1 Tax=Candidatus Mediterraneibacter quadrami TaxID=2838684 RepID=A0A9D2RF12_9FIRM|nr:hypothetical protein [Candidatus Mediterraneibacter quadrami]